MNARERAAAWLAALWAGQGVGSGFVAAPALFAALPRHVAGQAATAVFAADALAGLVAGAVLLLLCLGRMRREPPASIRRTRIDAALALAGLLCVLLGYYGLQPLMAPARAGQGPLSFAALHGLASAFFILKVGCAGVLAWRLTRGLRPAATSS
ncbi:MAG: DUF4149 domain-containing protein [Caldimonas sp.]